MSKVAKAMFLNGGLTPSGLMALTPAEFSELMLEETEASPQYEPGTLGHLVAVNAKLASDGKSPMAPGWLWPDVPTNRPGMKPTKRADRGR